MATRALITGASGLLGTWTLRHWDVLGIEAVPVSRQESDLLAHGAAEGLLDKHRPDLVVHLAWSASGMADYRTSPDNERWVDASLQLAEACHRKGVRQWLTGTVVDDSRDAADAYSRAKSRLREALAPQIDSGDVGWLRPAYVFDEEARRPGLVAHALGARDRGDHALLRSPHSSHDFIHASDVGRAVVLAVAEDLRGLIPIGSGRARTVADLVSALGVEWQADCSDTHTPTIHAASATDPSRLHRLGWSPRQTEEFFGP